MEQSTDQHVQRLDRSLSLVALELARHEKRTLEPGPQPSSVFDVAPQAVNDCTTVVKRADDPTAAPAAHLAQHPREVQTLASACRSAIKP